MDQHTYTTDLTWAGSTGAGYRGYDRAHTVTLGRAGPLRLSADPAFRGDPGLANPEQLLLAAASSCQLLSFLAIAARARLDVVRYADTATAVMPADARPMRITEIVLTPQITARGCDAAAVRAMVAQAHEQCYVASTLTAAVRIAPTVTIIS